MCVCVCTCERSIILTLHSVVHSLLEPYISLLQGHSKVIKYLVDYVTQFPSDADLTRYINTLSDKVSYMSVGYMCVVVEQWLQPIRIDLFEQSMIIFIELHIC